MATTSRRETTELRNGSPERLALQRLRVRYQQDHDLFSGREFAHLRFLRWLHRSGRLIP